MCIVSRTTVSDPNKPLEGMKFVIIGKKFTKNKKILKEKVQELGGEVIKKITKETAAVITTPGKISLLIIVYVGLPLPSLNLLFSKPCVSVLTAIC